MLDKGQENSLVEQVRRGDQDAMTAIVKEYEKPVFNAAFRMLGNREDAADVTQTTFLNVFQKIEQFNPSYKLFSWIYRIAMNESVNILKRQTRNEPFIDVVQSGDPTAAEELDSSRASKEIQEALMRLTEDYRSVIVLRYFTGSNYEEIAATLQIPEKTVKSRLYSARQQLKSSLENKQVLNRD